MTNNDTMFTRLYMIRHGQTEWNKKKKIQGILDDIPLNENGMRQAKAVAERLHDQYQVNVVFSSKAVRAQETAKIICDQFQSSMIITENLNEINFGSFSGLTIDEIETHFPEYFESFHHFITTNRAEGTQRPVIPNGESITHISQRIKLFLAEILIEHQGKQIAAVSHGSFIKCMLTYLSGESLHNYLPYWIENASISIIDFYGSIPMIRRLNDSNHIKDTKLDFIVPRII